MAESLVHFLSRWCRFHLNWKDVTKIAPHHLRSSIPTPLAGNMRRPSPLSKLTCVPRKDVKISADWTQYQLTTDNLDKGIKLMLGEIPSKTQVKKRHPFRVQWLRVAPRRSACCAAASYEYTCHGAGSWDWGS